MENENEHVAHDVDVAEPPHDDDEDVDDVDVDDDNDVNDIRAEGVVWDDDEAADEKEDNSDDPVAEGEEPADKLPDPSMKLHGENKFSNLCKLLEHICKRKSNKSRTFTKQAMLEKLFPPKLFEIENARLEAFFQSPGDQPPPESIFPMLRLLYPDKDGSRSLGMQEGKLADAYIDAFDWNKNCKQFKMLKNPNDPKLFGQDHGIAGNFSLVVQKVLSGIDGEPPKIGPTPSNLTLSDINQALDELSAIHKQGRNGNKSTITSSSSKGKPKAKKIQIAQWLKQFTHGARRIPPLEHKWLVRIIMGKLEFGIGFDIAAKHYHFMAVQMFSAHSSLRAVCNKICYIPRVRRVSSSDEVADTEGFVNSAGTLSYLQGPSTNVQLGKVFSPMLSQKTGFEKILNDISKRHRAFAKAATEAAANREESHRVTNSLACQHPAFTIETKLDGDRMLMHYEKDGSLVKFHSRKGNWFSTGYSPVLGPAIRKAFGWADLDLILDGEVIAWDNGHEETVPFGFNRTIARKRQEYMDRNGLLDRKDRDLHKDEKDSKVYNMTTSWDGKSSEETADLTGKECWLQYIVFDVVYVGGPGAADFLSKTVSSYIKPEPGCIMGLDAFERKKILYRLCRTQANVVEIVPTLVVRPNGGTELGSKYFSDTDPLQEYGHPAHKIDSIASLLAVHVPNIAQIDERQRERLTNEEISQTRANAIDRHYKEIVEQRRLEGLVFKDLNTPYVLDLESRGLRYWHKFKPDYFNGSIASDLDVVVVGAYFATGLRHSGKPSSFLVACLDGKLYNEYGEIKFLTLCKVNGGSTAYKDLNRLLDETGFKAATRDNAVDIGKWFVLDDRGTPDFLSSPPIVQESSQSQLSQSQSSQGQSWRFNKKDYPDLWIDPEDSKILTLNAGEIVFSNAFSAGLTLRFPTITKVRFDGDDKSLHEIESDLSLWAKYNSVSEDRTQSAPEKSFRPGSSSRPQGQTKCRFLTERQQQLAQKTKRMRQRKRQGVEIAPNPEQPTSSILKGVTFTVLDGVYRLDLTGLDAKEALEQGWLDEAKAVRDKHAVAAFVKDHGGTIIVSTRLDGQCYELGGRSDDTLVKAHIQRVEQVLNKKPTGKKLTKRDEDDRRVAKFEGVLRWTFVYSLVHRWKAAGGSTDTPIKEANPTFLEPAATDYLARPFAKGKNRLLDLAATPLTSANIERVLQMVAERSNIDIGQTKKREPPLPSWQYAATKQLKFEELWVMDCGNQPLWPYKRDQTRGDASKVVLYPDVFGGDFGDELSSLPAGGDFAINDGGRHVSKESRFGVITPAIPLARVCGAYVTSHLHVGVTHVMCDLKEKSNRIVEYRSGLTTEMVFRYPSDGKRILDRLRILEPRRIERHIIYLVSPDWLRMDVWGSEGISANDS